jgi:hypothetical protein
MKTKKEFLENILNNPTFKSASAKLSPEEKKRVDSLIFGDLFNMFYDLHSKFGKIADDSVTSQKFVDAINERANVSTLGTEGAVDVNGKA